MQPPYRLIDIYLKNGLMLLFVITSFVDEKIARSGLASCHPLLFVSQTSKLPEIEIRVITNFGAKMSLLTSPYSTSID